MAKTGVTDKEISKNPCEYCEYQREGFSLRLFYRKLFLDYCTTCAKKGGVDNNFVFNEIDYWRISPTCVEEFMVDSKIEETPQKKKTKFTFIYGED